MIQAPSNRVVHLELHTGDLPSARDFYARLCAWRPQRVDAAAGSYLASRWGPASAAGSSSARSSTRCGFPMSRSPRSPRPPNGPGCSEPAVLLEPREGPAGWRSVIAAPAGGEIAFWQRKR